MTESTINVGTFLIVNFPFISRNILAAPAHGVHISLILVFVSSSYFMDRTQLPTQNLRKQGYIALMLKSSLQKFYNRHHQLVDRYEIPISQMAMDRLSFT